MNVFEDVTLSWDGKDYTIPANKMMKCIARLEEVVTLNELHGYALRGGAPIGKLAMAYGAVLRYAGATVTDEEIYLNLMRKLSDVGIITSVKNILSLMLPAEIRKKVEEGLAAADAGEKKPEAPQAGNSEATKTIN